MNNENPFGITKSEIMDLAANKLADQMSDTEFLEGLVTSKIESRIDELFKSSINAKVDAFLSTEMERILSKEIVPVDIWGESTGEPTTIKAVLAKRAREFWDTKVNSEGKPGDYYSNKARHEWLFAKIVQDEFAAAVKQNITNLVGSFKESISASATKIVQEHINQIIQVRTK